MDRGRSFRILGISETATKEQVKAAFERKAARYKGPDYAEEPAYAERKLAQLYQAYQEACDLAENAPAAYKPEQRRIAKPKERATGPREDDEHNAREKFHQWMERHDDKKQHRKNSRQEEGISLPKLKKPELKLPNLQMPDFSKLKEKINEVLPENELFQDEEETGVEMGGSEVYTPAESDSKKDEKIGSIISLVVALVIFAIGACDGSSEPDYSYEDEDTTAYTYIYDEDWDLTTEKDDRIAELANQSYDLLLDQEGNGTATTYEETQGDYQEQAQLFVKNYFGKELVKDTAADLYERFPSFAVMEDDVMSDQLDAIFAFYGFAPLSSAVWYGNPYTGGRIEGYADYLDYLNQFYEEQGGEG